jgi:DNA-binding NarL/FixJ family response regulator
MALSRVVVADDLAPLLGTIAEQLEGSFDVVGLVTNGRDALEATLRLNPDLVLLDISMPGMNGIEVAEELKARLHQSKIVFLTALEDPDILTVCLASGALGYVVKSLMDSDLIPAMHDALAGRVFVSHLS